ncbi:cyclic lactone autoinducer peptide [Faecalimicrobium sp. JNUCC 81]
MNKFFKKNMKYIGSFAMFVAFMSANSVSLWYNHQPEMPEKLKNRK